MSSATCGRFRSIFTASLPQSLLIIILLAVGNAHCVLSLLLSGPAVAQDYAPGDMVLTAKAQTARDFMNLDQYISPRSASGAFSGKISIANVEATTGDTLKGLGYTYTVCIPNLLGGCVYSHDYGLTMDMEFASSGPLIYNYNIPFLARFKFPSTVYPGQVLLLEPTYEWTANASLSAEQSLEYHQSTSTNVDAPGDGMDDLATAFTQFADRANLSVSIPAIPGLSSLPVNATLTMPPFSEGGGAYGGSYTRLGGTGVLPSNGGITFGESTDGISVRATSPKLPAWRQGSEVFALTSTILGYIPAGATQAASLALSAVRSAGDFRLNIDLIGDVSRVDVVTVKVNSPALAVQVPTTLKPGDVWDFTDLPLQVEYGVRTRTDTYYPVNLTVLFDMRKISEQTIVASDLGEIPAGGHETGWQQASTTLSISGSVPVVRREDTPKPLHLDRLDEIAIRKPKGDAFVPPVLPPELTATPAPIVRKRTSSKVLVALDKPDRNVATPNHGEYAVVLGVAAPARSSRLANWFSAKGVTIYRSGNTTGEQILAFGVFRHKTDAERLANSLQMAFDVPVAVQARGEHFVQRRLDAAFETRLLAHP
jgi:hypothetical protein